MTQHIHNLLQIHEYFSFTAILGTAHTDFVKCGPIADVLWHGVRLHGTVKGVNNAAGGIVGVLLEIPYVV